MSEQQAIHAAHAITTADAWGIAVHGEVDEDGEIWIVEKVAPDGAVIERSMIAPDQSLRAILAWV